MNTVDKIIRHEVWANRLVLAHLNHTQEGDTTLAAEGAIKVFSEIATREELEGVANALAAKLAEHLAASQPVNAARNVANNIAMMVDCLD